MEKEGYGDILHLPRNDGAAFGSGSGVPRPSRLGFLGLVRWKGMQSHLPPQDPGSLGV